MATRIARPATPRVHSNGFGHQPPTPAHDRVGVQSCGCDARRQSCSDKKDRALVHARPASPWHRPAHDVSGEVYCPARPRLTVGWNRMLRRRNSPSCRRTSSTITPTDWMARRSSSSDTSSSLDLLVLVVALLVLQSSLQCPWGSIAPAAG